MFFDISRFLISKHSLSRHFEKYSLSRHYKCWSVDHVLRDSRDSRGFPIDRSFLFRNCSSHCRSIDQQLEQYTYTIFCQLSSSLIYATLPSLLLLYTRVWLAIYNIHIIIVVPMYLLAPESLVPLHHRVLNDNVTCLSCCSMHIIFIMLRASLWTCGKLKSGKFM